MQNREELAQEIERTVKAAYHEFKDLPESIVEMRPAPGGWSSKEVLGHLIDSAANNHQRFVRLQLVETLIFPNYGPDNSKWISIQNYQGRRWVELLDLWSHFNMHLSWIIRVVDESSLGHIWQADSDKTITLAEMMSDYLRHINDHLEQIRAIAPSQK